MALCMLMFTLPALVTLWTLLILNMSKNLHLGGHILLWHSCQNQKPVKRRACLEIQRSLKNKHHLRRIKNLRIKMRVQLNISHIGNQMLQ
uniref:Uncharacterized protein n=1 Tax=Arundo donax TaxID=35708 RepID=A0A0A9CVA2_ARUDO